MKTVQWLAVAIASVASLPLLAQQMDASGQQNTSVTAGKTQVQDSSGANAAGSMGHGHTNANGAAGNSASVSGPRGNSAATTSGSANAAGQMRPVNGELQGRLDSKTAKAGDPVVVKTTQKMTTAEGTEIPKGSRLVGHVTSAQAHAKGQAQSQLGIVFDRAELKGGQSIGIHSMIESVAPPASAMAAAEADDSASAMMGAGPVSMGGGMAGGARPGAVVGGAGMVNSAVDGTGNAAGRMGSGLNTAAGESMTAAGRVSTSAVGAAQGAAHTGVGATGSLATHATAVPGVMLSGDAAGSASGMLTATGRNVELQSGSQIVLGVAAAR